MDEQVILTVTQLNQLSANVLRDSLGRVWIRGEVSNVSQPSSGHFYFSLKDENAQIRCALFRGQQRFCQVLPEAGIEVLIEAEVTIYQARGDYQLICYQMEHAGDGALQRAFELLKQQLTKEGLFDLIHKKSLPAMPQTIGVVTSPTGAAIRDILKVLKRRAPLVTVIIYPTLVQGKTAAASIAAMINKANERYECDVLIVARGGGSLEDLWAFNEEIVARSIFNSKIPVITGIGHEVDITIADFVADQRAATPSAAAELCVPHYEERLRLLSQLARQLQRFIAQQITHYQFYLNQLHKRLVHPQQQLELQAQQLDRLEMKLQYLWQQAWQARQQQLQRLTEQLATLSPLSTLARGYSIIMNAQSEIIRNVSQVNSQETLTARLADGSIKLQVREICHPDQSERSERSGGI